MTDININLNNMIEKIGTEIRTCIFCFFAIALMHLFFFFGYVFLILHKFFKGGC